MKKIIYFCLFAALIFTPVLVMAEDGGVTYDRSGQNDDMSDNVAEMEKLRVEQERKKDEAAGKKGPSDTEEMTDILEEESTYDD